MENTKTKHHHRYLYQFEVVVTVLALILLGFGLYNSVFGQTGGYSTYGNPGFYDGVAFPQSGGTGYPAGDLVGPEHQGVYVDAVVDYSNTSTGSGSTGGQTAGYVTGGYFGTGGGVYNYQGIHDADPSLNQGGYINIKGSGVYNYQGILEDGAVLTTGTTISGSGQGVFTPNSFNDQNLTNLTQSNVSIKNCEFITKYHKFGDRGGDVPKIQQFLKDRGYYNGRIDGVYGIGTFRAVRNFQKDYKDKILDPWEFNNKASVEGTGITSVSTKYAINKMVGCPDPATIIPKTGKVLNY